MSAPSISIAMATCNGENFLEAQLQSLVTQTLLPLELVVCDDRSSDRTPSILEDFSDRAPFAVRISVNERTLGPGENFLRAASQCTGDWIAFCDQDDVWSEHKLARVAAVIESVADVGLVSHSARQVGPDLEPVRGLPDHPGHGRLRVTEPLRNPPMRSLPAFSCVFRRSLFARVSYEDRPRHKSRPDRPEPHDNFVYNVVNTYARLVRMPDVLAMHRRHAEAFTGAPGSGIKKGYAAKKLRSRGEDHAEALANLSDVAGSYRDYYERVLERGRSVARGETWLRRTEAAVDYYDALSRAYAARAAIHRPDSVLRDRVRAFGRCLAMRAYADHAGGRGIGRAALFRDAVTVIGLW